MTTDHSHINTVAHQQQHSIKYRQQPLAPLPYKVFTVVCNEERKVQKSHWWNKILDIVTSWSQTMKHATLDHYTHHFLSCFQMKRFPQFDCLWDKAVLRLLWYWIVCSGLCITNNSFYSALLAWMVAGWLCFTSMIYPTWFFFLSRLHLDSKVLASLNLHQLLLQCFYC